MKRKFLGIILSLVMITGCSKSVKISNGEEVIASVDGKDFTANELYDSMKNQYGASILIDMIDSYIANQEITDNEDANTYADSLISQYKLQLGDDFNKALTQAGYESVDSFKDYIVSSYKKNETVKKFLKDEVSDKEIQKYYDEKISEELNVKHILIKPDAADDATAEEKSEAESVAYNKAADIISKLNDGADFEELAKEYSADEATATNGGVINNVTKDGFVSEFYEAAYALEEGKYTTTPIKTTYGYHIIYLVSKNDKEPLENLKDTIIDSIVEDKLNNDSSIQQTTFKKIREKYNLSIADSKINNIYKSSISE